MRRQSKNKKITAETRDKERIHEMHVSEVYFSPRKLIMAGV